jgi:hypothetical protein
MATSPYNPPNGTSSKTTTARPTQFTSKENSHIPIATPDKTTTQNKWSLSHAPSTTHHALTRQHAIDATNYQTQAATFAYTKTDDVMNVTNSNKINAHVQTSPP